MSNVIEINGSQVDAIISQEGKAVLIDFWAPWCGPCKTISPIVEHLAEEYEDDIQVVKINVDEEPELAQKFGVRGIPMLTILQKGTVVATKSGVASLKDLRTFVETSISECRVD